MIEVRATDADDPTTANGELRYSLTPDGDLSGFEIDSITGFYFSDCNLFTQNDEFFTMIAERVNYQAEELE